MGKQSYWKSLLLTRGGKAGALGSVKGVLLVETKNWYDINKQHCSEYAKNYRKKHGSRLNKNRRDYYRAHKTEENLYYRQKMEEFTARAVRFLGGKCERCGLETAWHEVYDFHHRNHDEKEHQIFWLRCKDWESIVVPELKKCVLLCCNCHSSLTQLEARSNPNRSSRSLRSDERIDNHKQRCVDYLGRTCQVCGLQTLDLPQYHFHHVDQSTKLYKISNLVGRDWDKIIRPELDKCCLLCGNCHRSVHYGRYNNSTLVAGPKEGVI